MEAYAMHKSDYDDDFTYYLDNEYESLGGDYFECNGGHVWHLSNIESLWFDMPC